MFGSVVGSGRMERGLICKGILRRCGVIRDGEMAYGREMGDERINSIIEDIYTVISRKIFG